MILRSILSLSSYSNTSSLIPHHVSTCQPSTICRRPGSLTTCSEACELGEKAVRPCDSGTVRQCNIVIITLHRYYHQARSTLVCAEEKCSIRNIPALSVRREYEVYPHNRTICWKQGRLDSPAGDARPPVVITRFTRSLPQFQKRDSNSYYLKRVL